MTDIPPTPAATLARARKIALEHGLRYVYTGNVHDRKAARPIARAAAATVIRARLVPHPRLQSHEDGRCKECGAAIAGRFGQFKKPFGPRRIPVRLAAV